MQFVWCNIALAMKIVAELRGHGDIPTDIAGVNYRERPDGRGDVLIRTNSVMRTNNGATQITVGLYGVPNVKEVAGLVMKLRAQPVAS